MELTMQERKKLTLVKAQASLRAGKTRKSAMLDNFCESTGYQRTYAARVLHQAGQRYIVGETILVADPGSASTDIVLPWCPGCRSGRARWRTGGRLQLDPDRYRPDDRMD